MNHPPEGEGHAPAAPAADHERQRGEYFFLRHLQSVRAASGDYYCNQRFLGRGGNGTAFLVTCTSGPNFGIQFALKVLHRLSDVHRRAAFEREVQHLKTLSHPAIVRVFDEGVFQAGERQHPFVVMECVPTTLRQILRRAEVPRLDALRITMHCLSALCLMHGREEPVIHRDIKPENILLSDGLAKLADFGLAKVLEAAEEEAEDGGDQGDEEGVQGDAEAHPDPDGDTDNLTQWPGMPRRYRTPELVARARGDAIELTPATDIFQLGTVVYEILTGFNPQRPPRDALNDIELDARDIRGAGGAELTALVQDMLKLVPTERPQAASCLDRLNRIHKDLCRTLAGIEGNPV